MNRRMILALLAVSGLMACLSFAQEAAQLEGAAMGNTQTGWRWCSKCDGLSNVTGGVGPCPAGGTHATGGSSPYVLILNGPNSGGDKGWYRCSKCKGLFIPDSSYGVCAAGGTHDSTGSAEYCLWVKCEAEVGQPGWRRCINCNGAFYAGYAPHGVCPAGGQHVTMPWLHEYKLLSESELPVLLGHVYVAEYHVAGANVQATRGGTTVKTKTKADGTFCFTKFGLGKTTVKATKRKVGEATGTIRIKSGDAKFVDLELEK